MAGCLTARQEAVLSRWPTNRVVDGAAATPELASDQTYSFDLLDRSGTQDLFALRLAPDAVLEKRYHKEHDITLSVASGSAIVIVETMRYVVEAGDAVLLPRYTAYSIKPNNGDGDFVALCIVSPQFEGEDVIMAE
jgi:mannose-6-phosphate isomerase-like protein (cupin superfamily)